MTRTLRLALAAAAVLALSPRPGAAQDAPRQPQIPDLKVEKYALPNGLEVILHEDHDVPVVGVNLWYKVGSKDEKKGRTGFAHLFEHMMFQGSKHHDKEYFAPIEKLGANINGSTNTDRTNYFETLPSNGLELALWLEADRMGWLLPALSQEKLDNQREVVKNERRLRVDNVPYGQSMERMLEALYPEDHPYHHSVIGSMADLSAASREDVANFFRTYYVPNNATLVISGDFQPEEAKALVAKYFGPIPKGPEVARPQARVPELAESKHVKMTDRVALARAQLAIPTVPVGHPDEAALDVLATVLGQLDKENRLYKTLVYDKQLATSAFAGHQTSQLSGTFVVGITARPGQGLDELVALADAEIARMQKDGPTADEVAKAQTDRERSLIFSLEDVGGKADFLNANNYFYGDPLAYKDELKRLFAVTPADVKRVANEYLKRNRVRLDVTPGPQAQRAPEVAVDRQGQPDVAAAAPEVKDAFDRSVMPTPGPTPEFTPPSFVRRELANGMDVLIAERHELPIVAINLAIKGGANLEPAGKEGLADMMASLMTEGTARRDAIGLASALSEIGASLGANSGREESGLTLTTLTKNLGPALDLFKEVLLQPTFPEAELERLRKQRLAGILRRADDPQSIGRLVFPKTLYGADHPYGRIDTKASVEGIGRADVEALYRALFQPQNAALIVVGDVKPDEIVAKLDAAMAGWKPGDTKAPAAAEAPKAATAGLYLVDKPGAAQSVLYVGQVGVPRKTPDYFALDVLNSVLGGQFSSRLNLNLREAKGYTYGARSGFSFRQGPGPFSAVTSVQTAVTKEALAEVVKEIRDITGPRPVTAEELAFAKDNTIKGFPSGFGTTFGVAGQLAELVTFALPDDYFRTYRAAVEAVTAEDVARVAKKYLDPENLTIVVVGDAAKIEEGLKSLPFGKSIRRLDPEGNPADAAGTPAATQR
jgi:zinc protease